MSVVVRRVTSPAGDPAWLVSGYDKIRQLLTDPRLGLSHPDPGNAARLSGSVIFGQPRQSSPTEREDHAWIRRLLARSFSARRLASLRPRVQHLVDGLLEDLARRTPPVDFHEAISFPLPALVICELLGVPFEDRDDFRRWSDEAADMSDQARSSAGLRALMQYIGRLVARKLDEPAEDVLSDLVAVHRKNPDGFPLDRVAELGAGLLFAGHETTVGAIDRGVLLLLGNQDQREALARDPELVPAAVEEILRSLFTEPEDPERVGGLPRWTNTELTVEGVTIPAGDLVLLDVQGANHEADVFATPEVFDVSRANNPHLTFGHGPHFCAGAPLARMELQALFGTLFGRFPTLRLAVSAESLEPRRFRLTGGLEELPVTW
ncbi:MAG TPA: cytochrome P450 [Pseudonocardiaceae bacterium]|nr:cytochrome P450 [Pseudonocardiaceae bacterium]